MENISWSKNMEGYSRQDDIKSRSRGAVVTHKEKDVSKSKEELLAMIDAVTVEFQKKYDYAPTPEVGNCIVSLNSIKLD